MANFCEPGNQGPGQVGYNRGMNAPSQAERVPVIHNQGSGQGDSGLPEFVRELSQRGLNGELRVLRPGVSLPPGSSDAAG